MPISNAEGQRIGKMANKRSTDKQTDDEEEYDSLDGAPPSYTSDRGVRRHSRLSNNSNLRRTNYMATENYDSVDNGVATADLVGIENFSRGNSEDLTDPGGDLKVKRQRAAGGVDVSDGEMVEDSDDEQEEQQSPHQGCECGGSGSCVKSLLENSWATRRPDSALRTETMNKKGNELIQRHVMVANKPLYTYTPKDLFALITRSRGNLSKVWLVEEAPQTFLHTAVIARRPEIIPVLVDCGLLLDLFDCTVRDPNSEFLNYKALEIAKLHKNESMITLLNQQKQIASSFGWLHASARDGNMAAVQHLMRNHPHLLNQPEPPLNLPASTVQRHSGTEPIYWAVTSGCGKLVSMMLEMGANVQSISSEGETLLTRAVSLGHLDLVKLLVNTYHMDTNEPGYQHKSCLQRAIENRDAPMVKVLMELGAQVQDSLLNDIASSGHVQMFLNLRCYFHNLDVQDEHGKFPLYYAILHDHLQMADELIKEGARLNLKDRQQRNLLHLVVNKKNEDAFDFILRHLRQKKNKKKTLLTELINQRDRYMGAERCFLVRGRDQGSPAYHYVDVNRCHLHLFRKLTRTGEGIDVVLYGSVVQSGWGSAPPPAEVQSMEKRFDLSKVTDRSPLDLTPLNLAILKDNFKMAIKLIDAGADTNIPDCFGMTPMHMSCMQGSLEVTLHLEKKGGRLQVVDLDGRTPQQTANENEHHHIVNFLRGQEIITMKELKKFVEALKDIGVKISEAKLQESRGEGTDLIQYLLQELRQLQGEMNKLLFVLGKGPIMEETSYASVMTESHYHASQR